MSNWKVKGRKINIHPTAKIHPTAILMGWVDIHEGVEIGPYCVIGANPERNGWENEEGCVEIFDYAQLKGFNTVDAGSENQTFIGKRTKLLKHAHVGHDADIWNDVVLSCGSRIGGHAIIHNHCNIGLNASVHQWKEVPKGVMLGMNSCITKKTRLEEYAIYAGVPAKYIGENKVLKQRLGL